MEKSGEENFLRKYEKKTENTILQIFLFATSVELLIFNVDLIGGFIKAIQPI